MEFITKLKFETFLLNQSASKDVYSLTNKIIGKIYYDISKPNIFTLHFYDEANILNGIIDNIVFFDKIEDNPVRRIFVHLVLKELSKQGIESKFFMYKDEEYSYGTFIQNKK
jgi:hypothetical protein